MNRVLEKLPNLESLTGSIYIKWKLQGGTASRAPIFISFLPVIFLSRAQPFGSEKICLELHSETKLEKNLA
jgi:hypothetical protein